MSQPNVAHAGDGPVGRPRARTFRTNCCCHQIQATPVTPTPSSVIRLA